MQTEVELPPGYDLADYTLRWSDRFGPLKCCTWVFKGTPKDSEDRYVCVGRNAMFFIQADVFEYHVLDLTPDEAFEDFCEKDPICDVWDKRGKDIKIETTYKPQLLRIFSSQIGEAFTVIPRNRVNTWRNKIDWSEELSPKEIKNGKATLKEVLPVYIEYWKTIGREAATYSQSITTSVAKGGGYGRYWLPKLTTPVPIYFFSDTLSTRDLKKIVEAVMSKPSNSKNPGYTSFEPRFTSPPNKKLVCISVHPFGYYRTLLEPNDLQTLVKAQMEGSKPGQDKWIREIPKKNIAEQFHGAMADALARKTVELKSLKRDNRTTRTRFDLNLGDLASGPDRKGTDTFMGQSANKWATQILGWGPSASNGNEVVAEWLHRSAHSFGKLNDGTSPDLPFNIMFGTQECNTHMCRAENMIHRTNALAKDLKKQAPQTSRRGLQQKIYNKQKQLARPDPDEAELNTRAIWEGSVDMVQPDGTMKQVTVAPYGGFTGGCPWLLASLQYQIMYSVMGKFVVAYTSNFFPFHRYIPLRLEVSIDNAVLDHVTSKLKPSDKDDDDDEEELWKKRKQKKQPLLSMSIAQPMMTFRAVSELASNPSLQQQNQSILASEPQQSQISLNTINLESRATEIDLGVVPARNSSVGPSVTPPVSGVGVQVSRQTIDRRPAVPSSLSSLHPTQHAIWHQITKGQGTIQVQLPGVEVKGAAIASDPKSPQTPSSPCPPPHGFMVVGKIDLFNLHLDLPDLTFNSWHGPPPARVTLPRNTLPIYQHVEISQIHVADVIPLLEETPFKTFLLHNVVIMYQNCHFIPSKSIGWHFEGDITIDQSYGLMHTILTEQLKVLEENLDVHLHASLGPDFSWKEPPSLTGLCFEGSLILAPKDGGPDMKPTGIQVNDRVTLTAAGVRLFGIGSHTLGMDTKLQMTYDYQVNGALLLKVDGTLMPLEFNFAVSEQSGAAQLSGMLSGNIWSNVFGSGITLADVWILCSMDGTFNFEMGGTLKAGLTSISLSLQVSEGKYELTGEVEDLGIDGVIDIFEHLTGERLNPPGHVDITIGDATLVISNSGLSLNVEHMKIDKYESLSGAQVSISKTSGIHIRASIENQPFDDITLENASVDLVIARDASVWTTDVSLNGIVNFLDGSAKATATVHLYKSGSQLEWTVYGKFVDSQDGYPLANLLPIVKESFLGNLMLQEAALIVASQSGPDPSPHNSQRYDIQQGVQICAILGEISSFGSLLRRPTPMLTLRAAWSKKTGFILDILLPSPISIHIGRGITTDPIIAQLQTNPVGLLIEAGIKVPVAGSSAPLDFNASLTVDSDHVAIAAEMDGLWVDPFGIGQDVAVGPRVALKVEINLPLFCATGTPTTIGLEAGLQVGQAKADIAVIMSEDPSQELLTGKIDHLTVPNLVHFFNEVTGLDIPEPPDFFDFNTVNLYMSEGVTIGKQAYPAGFSFDASMNIFGTTLTAHAGITGGTFALNAAVDKIDIGPLTISGHDGKPLTLDLTFGTTVQHLHFDGEIDFIGIKAATLLVLDLQPSPAFSFDFLLSFTELLQFKVDAHMSGETVDVKDLSTLDFELHAEMEQHILDYIRDQVKAALEKARKTEISAFDSAQKTLLDAKAEYQKNLTSAQADMTSKYESWQKHSQDVHMASQRVIDGYTNQMNKLQSNVDAERQKFNLALKDAEAKLETANSDRAAKMQAAKANLAGEKNKWDTEIANKESALEAAKAQLQQRFGSAEQDIDNAEAKVNSLQNQINSVESTINDYENAHWYEVWKKLAIPGLCVEVAGLEIAMNTADAVLGLAKGVVEGVDYLTVKGAIPIAEGALADVQKAGDAALDVATKLVDEADKITAAAVSLAEDALTGVQKGGDALWKGAEKALADFIATGKAILEGAQKAIDDLVHCAEWLAYQAAEAGLSIAKAATHAIDVANFALEGIKDAGSIIMQVAEDIVEAVLNLFEITKVTLDGKFSGMHHGGDGFDVSVTFKVGGGQPETVGLKLHLGGVVDFIQGLLEEILKKLTQTGVHG